MKTDLCSDEVVMHLGNPEILAAEGVGVGVAGAGGAATRTSSAAIECGRRLLLAARAGDTDTVRHLMAKGAPFTTDWLGTSPLHLAAANDHSETVGVLLRAGVSRDARTKTERTPLHLAAYAGHARSVAKLLEGGALVDARDLLRMTPLHWAAERGHAAAARLLLAAGADPRALSKFRKSPLCLARARPALRALLEDALRQREAASSVDALVVERTAEEAAMTTTPVSETSTVRIQRISDAKANNNYKIITTPEKKQNKSTPKIEVIKVQNAGDPAGDAGAGAGGGAGVTAGAGAGGAGAGGAGAEALLRRHGITLLPADDGSTVLSALQSGRTVVLSDAGKLMLKESGSGARAEGGGGAGGGAGGVVLTATPVSAPPPGVKVFTLNSSAKLLPLSKPTATATATATADHTATNKTPDKNDVQQVKLVQLGGPSATPAPPPAGAAGAGAARGAGRAAVRIIMNKQNFRKLIATATRATQAETVGGGAMEVEEGEEESSSGSDDGAESVVVVPEQFVRSSSPQYLRSQLLCAHAALHHLHRRLRRARLRLRAQRAGHT